MIATIGRTSSNPEKNQVEGKGEAEQAIDNQAAQKVQEPPKP